MQASRRGGKIVLHVDDDKGRARQVDPDILRRGRKVDGTNRRHHAHEIGMRFIDMPSVAGNRPRDAAMSCGNPGQDAQVVGIEFEPLACADQFGEPFVGHHEGQGVELVGAGVENPVLGAGAQHECVAFADGLFNPVAQGFAGARQDIEEFMGMAVGVGGVDPLTVKISTTATGVTPSSSGSNSKAK
jgi:hypothetical protein